MATMKDVAKAANVSVATVSNIINGKFTTRNDTYLINPGWAGALKNVSLRVWEATRERRSFKNIRISLPK